MEIHMSDKGDLAAAADAEAMRQQDEVAWVLAGALKGRAVLHSQVGGSGRIEASKSLEEYPGIDPVYIEARVGEILAESYRPNKYVVTVKYFDTRALHGASDYDAGVYRLYFWATPVTN
jgi:hypothetical protein